MTMDLRKGATDRRIVCAAVIMVTSATSLLLVTLGGDLGLAGPRLGWRVGDVLEKLGSPSRDSRSESAELGARMRNGHDYCLEYYEQGFLSTGAVRYYFFDEDVVTEMGREAAGR
jgi:hypothetical protein